MSTQILTKDKLDEIASRARQGKPTGRLYREEIYDSATDTYYIRRNLKDGWIPVGSHLTSRLTAKLTVPA